MMEDKKIVGPPEGGTQMRPVLDYGQPRRQRTMKWVKRVLAGDPFCLTTLKRKKPVCDT
jgi:hypothetical protein